MPVLHATYIFSWGLENTENRNGNGNRNRNRNRKGCQISYFLGTGRQDHKLPTVNNKFNGVNEALCRAVSGSKHSIWHLQPAPFLPTAENAAWVMTTANYQSMATKTPWSTHGGPRTLSGRNTWTYNFEGNTGTQCVVTKIWPVTVLFSTSGGLWIEADRHTHTHTLTLPLIPYRSRANH